MQHMKHWVPTSEVAYFAGLTDKDIYRVVEEQALPPSLHRLNDGRQFAPIVGVFARFYHTANEDLTKKARLWVIESLFDRIVHRRDAGAFLALRLDLPQKDSFDWAVSAPFGRVELWEVAQYVLKRVERLARATESVSVNPEVMGGIPVFAGTRLPIDTVAAAKGAGATDEEIIDTYEFLTPDLIEDAVIFQAAHPRRGRPRSLGELNPTWKALSSKTVQRGRSE